MSKRKSTPNVLEELLGPKSFDKVDTENNLSGTPEDHNASTLVSQKNDAPESHNTVEPESQDTSTPENNSASFQSSHNAGVLGKNNAIKPAASQLQKEDMKAGIPSGNKNGIPENKLDEQNKEKNTYYLSNDLMSELDDAWFQIRKEIGKNGRRRVTKSVIVELCIEQCLKEFKESGKNSSLFQEIEKLVGHD